MGKTKKNIVSAILESSYNRRSGDFNISITIPPGTYLSGKPLTGTIHSRQTWYGYDTIIDIHTSRKKNPQGGRFIGHIYRKVRKYKNYTLWPTIDADIKIGTKNSVIKMFIWSLDLDPKKHKVGIIHQAKTLQIQVRSFYLK